MELPNHPGDRDKKLKGLIAGERGRGFAEIIPEPKVYLQRLKSLGARKRKPRRKQRQKSGRSPSRWI